MINELIETERVYVEELFTVLMVSELCRFPLLSLVPKGTASVRLSPG